MDTELISAGAGKKKMKIKKIMRYIVMTVVILIDVIIQHFCK